MNTADHQLALEPSRRAPRRPRRAPPAPARSHPPPQPTGTDAAYASATSSAISARSRGSAARRSASSRSTHAASRPAPASARAASRRTATRCSPRGGSDSARPQQAGRRARRAAAHRRPPPPPASGPPPSHRPPAARPPDAPPPDPAGPHRRKQQPSGGTVQRVARVARQRALDRLAHNRMNEPRRIVGRQHLQTNQRGGERDRLRHLHAGNRRRVAQLAAVPEHRERLHERQRARTQPTNPGQHPPRHRLTPARHQLGRIELGQRTFARPGRPQQLGQVQRIAAARRPYRHTQLIRCPGTKLGANYRAGGSSRSTDPDATPPAPRRATLQAKRPPIPAHPDGARRAMPPPPPRDEERGEPTSATTDRLPNARRRPRSAAAIGRRG